MSGENTDPRSEPSIGRSLEMARKGRGLSLWQVEQETRIRSRYLRDLEREDFEVLPAVYVLGSLKTYADFLGLDGAALSRQLKASLVEPDEPDVSAQVAALGGAREEEDDYEAAPVPAVGFDQLFLGMGVILISILAIMTLAAAVAQDDRSPVSQVDQPSTPAPPSEIALAGNVQEEEDGGSGTSTTGDVEDGPGESPDASKDGEQDKDEDSKEDSSSSQATSIFGDAEFVPMSPSSPATASATSAASASASPAPPTAGPDASPVHADPAPAPVAPAPAGPAPEPANDHPRAASAPPDVSAPAPAANPAQAPAGPGGGGANSPQGPAPGSGQISPDAGRMIDEVFRANGLD
ncbi:MAG TPA: helix-turn-helix domain-containing protein [Rubrobacter sp.]|nr:helix-turn-helix domain-containing protein [Rubrobacter sp.]